MSKREMSRAFVKSVTSFPLLEADVLQSFSGHAVKLGRPFVIPPSSCQVAARNPSCRAMAS
jgi:hypothetical protein